MQPEPTLDLIPQAPELVPPLQMGKKLCNKVSVMG
uniref:Uncharacterized protein n=1 Tax=Arundo donax TaxID=35708 RepID=A0A0A8Y7T0_ARUDO